MGHSRSSTHARTSRKGSARKQAMATPAARPAEASRRRPALLLAVIALTVVAGLLRFRALDAKSLWWDELAQVQTYYASTPRQLVDQATVHGQPPLDYLIGYLIQRARRADSDWWVRFPAAVFGTLTVPAIVALGAEVGGPGVGLLAGLVAALSPLHVSMSQEARPYAIFTFLAVVVLILFAEARVRGGARRWACFGVGLFLCLMARAMDPVAMSGALLTYVVARRFLPDLARLVRKHVGRRERGRPRVALAERKAGFWPAVGVVLGALALSLPEQLRLLHSVRSQGIASLGGQAPGPGEWMRKVVHMVVPSYEQVAGPAGPVLLALVVVGAVALIARMVRRDSELTPRHREHAFVLLIVAPLMLIAHATVYSASTWVPPKPQYLLYQVAPLAVLSAVGLLAVLAPVRRKARPVHLILMAAGIGLLARWTMPALQAVYDPAKDQTKIDHRGIWVDLSVLAGETDTVVVLASSGIAPAASVELPFLGEWRYARAFRGSGYYTGKQLVETPGGLEGLSGRVILGATEHPKFGLPAPTSLPPAIGLTRRHLAWAMWVQRPSGSPQQQLCELLGLALRRVPAQSNTVYPFVLHAVLLERQRDHRGAMAALKGAFAQCTNPAQVPALRELAGRLIPRVISGLDGSRELERVVQSPH